MPLVAMRARYERLLERPEQALLVVCHEIPVRYALNAAGGLGRPRRPRALHPERDAVPVRRDALARAAVAHPALAG